MFNLVVTCVGSKNYDGPSIKNAIDNLIRLGIKDDVEELFKEWKKMLTNHMKSSSFLPKASNVYRGAMWNASIEAFNRINDPKRLWIMSCGFGFINSEERISGYHATFKSRENDSLYNKSYFHRLKESEVKKQWWNLLTEIGIVETNYPKSIHELVNKSTPDDVVLIAAGSDYYEAVYDDLSKIIVSEELPKLAFVGIKRLNGKFKPAIPKKLKPYICPYGDGRKLREFLGCSAIQVQSKSALHLIERYYKTGELKYEFP